MSAVMGKKGKESRWKFCCQKFPSVTSRVEEISCREKVEIRFFLREQLALERAITSLQSVGWNDSRGNLAQNIHCETRVCARERQTFSVCIFASRFHPSLSVCLATRSKTLQTGVRFRKIKKKKKRRKYFEDLLAKRSWLRFNYWKLYDRKWSKLIDKEIKYW